MIDSGLLRKINNGRCFVLVGAGPSCEVGYPSWEKLAKSVYEQLQNDGYVNDKESYDSYLERKKFPEFFRLAERDLGSREKLIDIIKVHLSPQQKKNGVIYNILCSWPFACYLTTNFDDELAKQLSQNGYHFSVISNRKEDFYVFREGVSNIIQKIHSDLDHINEAIITSEDYRKLYSSDEGTYFRDKLRQILEMFDVLIVGHSLSDPDIKHVLELAKKTASPLHPIYMIGADFTPADAREFLERYNIVLLRYPNKDGNHKRLKKSLYSANKFIIPRGELQNNVVLNEPCNTEEAQAAISLSLFRRLQSLKSNENITPLILTTLSNISKGISIEELVRHPPLNYLSSRHECSIAILDNINELINIGLVKQNDKNQYYLSKKGIDNVLEIQSVRNIEKEQAYGQLINNLQKKYALQQKDIEQCTDYAEKVIINTFSKRGLTIANNIFAGQSASSDELSDIFSYISNVAAGLKDIDLRLHFVDAMYEFVVAPNDPQKKYLGSISQGYFLYHLLGFDPQCSKLRHEIFKNTLWLYDASVILPLIATGSYNHEYAVELFSILNELQAISYTTYKLIKEAWQHYSWALNLVENHGIDSPEFIQAVLVKGSYKQNLFLDGYIRLSSEGRVGTFSDYLEILGIDGDNFESFQNSVKQKGIKVISPSEFNGFDQQDWGDIENLKEKIREERQQRGTYRSELQIESEAEIWSIVQFLRKRKYQLPEHDQPIEKCYFVSQSKIIDNVFQADALVTWTPEAVYRYLSALPNKHLNPDLLQQCMLSEYFYAGVSFIDKERYLRFFGPSINAAKISYQQEKENYIKAVERISLQDLDEAFNKTPDLEKPLFISQMAWKTAEIANSKAKILTKRVVEAENKVKQLESEKESAWKRRDKEILQQEEARQKNLQDPKHVRKRKRQAKKRKKNK